MCNITVYLVKVYLLVTDYDRSSTSEIIIVSVSSRLISAKIEPPKRTNSCMGVVRYVIRNAGRALCVDPRKVRNFRCIRKFGCGIEIQVVGVTGPPTSNCARECRLIRVVSGRGVDWVLGFCTL